MSEPKRRRVPEACRKRAKSSCDHCKKRKIKCERFDNNQNLTQDISMKCQSCQRLKIDCSTNFKEPITKYSDRLKTDLLETIVNDLLPDLDTSNLDELIEYTSNINNDIDSPKINDYAVERLVSDTEGKSHYIGYASTFALFNGLCSFVLKNSQKTKLTFDNHVHTYNKEIIEEDQMFNNDLTIGEVPILTMSSDFIPLWLKSPIKKFVNKDEVDFYVDIFFDKIHPYYFIYSEDVFREKYEKFWQEVYELTIFNEKNKKMPLKEKYIEIKKFRKFSSLWTFNIYLVWILGAIFKNHPNAELNDQLIEKLVEFIILGFSKVILRPSLSGIRILYLLSIYLFSGKNKNSAWILIGIACRQAISLGLHRDIGVLYLKYKRPISLRKQIWWSLYIFETDMSSSFGRPRSLLNKDINIGKPTDLYIKTGKEDFLPYFLQIIKLSRLLNEIIEVRGLIYDNNKLLSPFNSKIINKTLKILNNLKEFKKNLIAEKLNFEQSLLSNNNKNIERYKLDLTLRYHFNMIIMSLPFISYTVNILVVEPNLLVKINSSIIMILSNGILSSIELSNMIFKYYELDILEGNLFSDLFYAYVTIMVLVLVLFMIKAFKLINSDYNLKVQLLNNNNIDFKKVLNQIQKLRIAINSNKLVVGESNKRILKIVEDFLNDVGIIAILKNVNNQNNINNLKFLDDFQFNDYSSVRNDTKSSLLKGTELQTTDSFIMENVQWDKNLEFANDRLLNDLFLTDQEGRGMWIDFTENQLQDFINEWSEM